MVETKTSGDRDVLLGFPDGAMKALVLAMLWEQPRLSIDSQNLTLFSDLHPLTIHKRGEWKFLTSKLVRIEIPYKWGYPFKLLINYKERRMVIKSLGQANDLRQNYQRRRWRWRY